MTYEEYLKTPHWEAKRVEALIYYGRSCALCGSPVRLHVHHRNYDSLWCESVKRDLSVLCKYHHEDYHEREIHPEPEFTLTEQLFMGLTDKT